MRATKARLSVYLDADIMSALAAYADRRDLSRSLVAEAAIASFLSPDADEQREAAIARRLDRIDRRMARAERDIAIGIEMSAMFVRFWLTSTSPPAEAERALLRRLGNDRYDAFIQALGRRLAKGPRLREELREDIAERKDDQPSGLRV